MTKTERPLHIYLRKETLPTAFCPGCGLGIVSGCFLRAVQELGFEDLRNFVFCCGIGCTAWIPSPYYKADTLHVTHGRAIPVALGVKVFRPELRIVVFGGDGDLASIGLNHLIQAARRNLEITVIMANNMVYGMTGGQLAPTTPYGARTTTTPYGNIECPIDIAELLTSAGASYVARWTTAHPIQLKESIMKAIKTDGFAFIEAVSQCPTNYGRRVGFESPVEMLKWFKDNSVEKERKTKEGKIVVGEFVERQRPGFAGMMHDRKRSSVGSET